jgi:hypothetical protein
MINHAYSLCYAAKPPIAERIMMSHHEPVAALLALLAIVLVLASLLLLAVATDNLHGSIQVQAEYAGFDALANQLFGASLDKTAAVK